jgi:hypothetical protein
VSAAQDAAIVEAYRRLGSSYRVGGELGLNHVTVIRRLDALGEEVKPGSRPRGRGRPLVQRERQFQRQVEELAELRGWFVWHDQDSRRNAAGFPDLLLLRPPRLLWRELKSNRGRVEPAQERFLAALQACGQDAAIWRPRDWAQIEGELA